MDHASIVVLVTDLLTAFQLLSGYPAVPVQPEFIGCRSRRSIVDDPIDSWPGTAANYTGETLFRSNACNTNEPG